MQRAVLERLEAAGLKARAVPTERLAELRDELARLRADGIVGSRVGGYLAGFFHDENPAVPGKVRSLFIVASPSPIGRAVFHHNGEARTAQIPPTYLDDVRTPEVIAAQINEALAPFGYAAAILRRVPRKMLAAHAGLAEYGRNNVCYVEGMGSFAMLSCYCSDMPCEEDGWQEARRMAVCEGCRVCTTCCPTGAILPERDAIDAERCLTLHNEADSAVPFPDWIDVRAHNSLIGCMRCQAACPANRAYLGMITDVVTFDGAETLELLSGLPMEALSASTREKARLLNMDTYYEAVARNLRALLSPSC